MPWRLVFGSLSSFCCFAFSIFYIIFRRYFMWFVKYRYKIFALVNCRYHSVVCQRLLKTWTDKTCACPIAVLRFEIGYMFLGFNEKLEFVYHDTKRYWKCFFLLFRKNKIKSPNKSSMMYQMKNITERVTFQPSFLWI